MPRRTAIVGSLGLLIVALLVALPTLRAVAHAGTPMPVEQTVAFDVEFRDTILAASDSGLSPGDRFILSDRVVQSGQEVGHNSGECTVTDGAGGGEAICIVIWSLPEGTIATQLLNTPPPEKAFAIVGGTGRYQGVRGSGVLVEGPDQTGTVTFHLHSDRA